MIHKILHTSDWHIGRRLKEHDRTEEFRKFFDDLLRIVHDENIDALLAAGDIFDNTTPTVQAQDIYYSLLSRMVDSPCRHIVIISGNHDSPAFLDAPAELLKHCRIHIIGQARRNPADEVITLSDSYGTPELIVCAVPYLRDRDVRTLSPSDNPSDSESALIDGIKTHYARVFERAKELQEKHNIPVIAMGHLFMQGAKTSTDDNTRELYVGTSIRVGGDIFPEWLTYTALGHLHSPQKAGGRENIRYSGSPFAMGFGETGQKKAVYILELDGKELMALREVNIPEYQRLERVSGEWHEIESSIHQLGKENVSIWLDVTHTGSDSPGSLQARINDILKEYDQLELLSLHDDSRVNAVIHDTAFDGKTLDDFDPDSIFKAVLDDKNIDEERRNIYIPMYREILEKAKTGENS